MSERYRPTTIQEKDEIITGMYRNIPKSDRLGFISERMLLDYLPLWVQAKDSSPKKRKVLLNRLVGSITSWQQRIYHWDHIFENQEARSKGYETLTTDTQGHRPNQWFSETGFSFSTGTARPCAIAAIIHPEIGIAAAHRNPVNTKVIRRLLEEASDQWSLRTDHLIASAFASRLTDLNEEEITSTLSQTTSDALSEFQTLANKTGHASAPTNGTSLILCGMDGLPTQPPYLTPVIEQTLRNHPIFHGRRRGRNTNMGVLFDFFGQAGGFMYYGPDHPQPLEFIAEIY